MVGLIIFRDLFVTGLRMVVEQKGLSMVTSLIAKTKTTVQYIIIIFTLVVLGLKGMQYVWANSLLEFEKEFSLVYNLTLFITIFTVFTGLTYLNDNKSTIKQFLDHNET